MRLERHDMTRALGMSGLLISGLFITTCIAGLILAASMAVMTTVALVTFRRTL